MTLGDAIWGQHAETFVMSSQIMITDNIFPGVNLIKDIFLSIIFLLLLLWVQRGYGGRDLLMVNKNVTDVDPKYDDNDITDDTQWW